MKDPHAYGFGKTPVLGDCRACGTAEALCTHGLEVEGIPCCPTCGDADTHTHWLPIDDTESEAEPSDDSGEILVDGPDDATYRDVAEWERFEPDTTPAEFMATLEHGLPVRIVKSKAEYEQALQESKRPDWHHYFMGIAEAVADRADCTRRKVGAIVVKDHRIISTGYNGAPAGDPGCLSGACPRGQLSIEEIAEYSDYENGPGRCIGIHAEANALLYAGRTNTVGATLYITAEPCSQCWKLIHAAGIVKTVWTIEGQSELNQA